MPHAPIARVENAADPYRWLENRDSAEVLDYLTAENTYLEQMVKAEAATVQASQNLAPNPIAERLRSNLTAVGYQDFLDHEPASSIT